MLDELKDKSRGAEAKVQQDVVAVATESATRMSQTKSDRVHNAAHQQLAHNEYNQERYLWSTSNIWGFLDKMDKNLLYLYVSNLANGNRKSLYITRETGDMKRDELLNAETRRNSAFYLIWFVYRWVLGCETLEQAEQYANEETLKRYRLTPLFGHNQKRIYIGIYGVNEIYLYDYNSGDLNIVLEILYNRYDFIEQLECYIRRTQGTSRKNRFRCIKVLEETVEMMKGKAKFAGILKRYYDRKALQEENSMSERRNRQGEA